MGRAKSISVPRGTRAGLKIFRVTDDAEISRGVRVRKAEAEIGVNKFQSQTPSEKVEDAIARYSKTG